MMGLCGFWTIAIWVIFSRGFPSVGAYLLAIFEA